MGSVAEAVTIVPGRSIDPLEHIDYRRADTPEEKDRIYRLRYRAYLREGAILPSEAERVTDRYDDLPNNFIFGIYVPGDLPSPLPLHALPSQCPRPPSSP